MTKSIFGAVLLLAAISLAAAACSSTRSSPARIEEAGSRTLRGDGLALSLPPDWRGWIYTHSAPCAIVQVANFPMRSAYGYDDSASRARQHLKRGDILIVLLEVQPHAGYRVRRIQPPVMVRKDDFGAVLESVGAGVPFTRRGLSLHGRDFDLWVQFGGDTVRSDLLDETNEVLGTLRVGKARGYLSGANLIQSWMILSRYE